MDAASEQQPNRKPWVIGVLVALLAVAVVGVLVLAPFVGGVDELIPRSRPTEQSKKVVAARAKAEPTMASSLTALSDGPVRAALGSALRRVTPPTAASECTKGQHNWKIDDDYDLRCDLKGRVLVTATQAGFRDQMVRLHEALVAAGWVAVPADGGIPEVVNEYWDGFTGPSAPRAPEDGPYTQADLPSERYARADNPGIRLEIDWTDRTDAHHPEAASIPEGEYGMTITVTSEYFRG